MKEKPYEELTFDDDFMFGKVLTENPNICKEIAELATGRKVNRIENLTKQYTLEDLRSGRGVRFDVYFEDDQNTVYDFEMQTTKQKDLPHRTRYYQSMIDTHHLARKANYSDLPNSYIVFICLKDPFSQNQYRYTFENRCIDTAGELSLGDGTQKIFLNASGKESPSVPLSEELINFLNYVKGLPATDALTRSIEKAVENAKLDEGGRLLYMTLLERDEEKRAEGRAQGRTEGSDELSALISYLIKKKNFAEVERIANDSQYRSQRLALWRKEHQ